MYVVFLADAPADATSGERAGTSADARLAAIAQELAVAPYDARQRLAAGRPAVLFAGPDRARALELLGKLRALALPALACDTASVVASENMVSMRDFALDDEGLRADGQSLPFADVLCVLRATQRHTVETTTTQKEKSFSAGKAILTGGLVMSSTKSKEVTTSATDREQVLYLFRRSGQTPWLLRETQTRYGALGAALAPATMQNFLTTVRLLRERAPAAVHDERLVNFRINDVVSAAGGIDLLAHLLAMSIAKR